MAAATKGGGVAGPEINTGHFASVITAAETNQLKSAVGKVGHVVVWGADAGTTATLALYDALSGTTRQVWSWKTADGLGTFPIQMPMGIGIRVITAGTPPGSGGWTIVWS
jgi:hypothetical protein